MVLLDVMMEGISGVECCAEIRKYRGMAEHELPIILVTASESDLVMQNGFLAGATDFLQKPFALTVLLTRLESALRLRELFNSTAGAARVELRNSRESDDSATAPAYKVLSVCENLPVVSSLSILLPNDVIRFHRVKR